MSLRRKTSIRSSWRGQPAGRTTAACPEPGAHGSARQTVLLTGPGYREYAAEKFADAGATVTRRRPATGTSDAPVARITGRGGDAQAVMVTCPIRTRSMNSVKTVGPVDT